LEDKRGEREVRRGQVELLKGSKERGERLRVGEVGGSWARGGGGKERGGQVVRLV